MEIYHQCGKCEELLMILRNGAELARTIITCPSCGAHNEVGRPLNYYTAKAFVNVPTAAPFVKEE